jgi:hypothetical protein
MLQTGTGCGRLLPRPTYRLFQAAGLIDALLSGYGKSSNDETEDRHEESSRPENHGARQNQVTFPGLLATAALTFRR